MIRKGIISLPYQTNIISSPLPKCASNLSKLWCIPSLQGTSTLYNYTMYSRFDFITQVSKQ